VTHDLRVEVDEDVCIGSGECVRFAPAAFALEPGGVAVVTDPASVDADALRSAEAQCPSGAIRVYHSRSA
jgi:ferredoxin